MMSIIKNKRLSYAFIAITLGLATAMLLFGFGPIMYWKNTDISISLWDYIFELGWCKNFSYLAGFKYRFCSIIAFAMMLAAISCLIAMMVIKSKNFAPKSFDIGMLASVSSLLIISALLIFLSSVFGKAEFGGDVRLGWGAITSGILGTCGSVTTFLWFYTHPES